MTALTPERLAGIRDRDARAEWFLSKPVAFEAAEEDRAALLSHVDHLTADNARLREIVAVADRVAASLGLVLHDAHPTFGSTALWRGGIGGQALTSHCSIVHGAHPGGEWAEFDLPSHYLREWVSLRGDAYDHDEMKATVRADLLALLNPPTEGETDE